MNLTTTDQTSDVEVLIEVREACRSGKARQLRLAAGLTQGEIARACGVTDAAVTRWEAGDRRPTGERAVAYGRVLREVARGLLG
jgi:transcriptional regulator with XRE-family HTH domain